MTVESPIFFSLLLTISGHFHYSLAAVQCVGVPQRAAVISSLTVC